jgi:predicted AAA+ superfamily ATPase
MPHRRPRHALDLVLAKSRFAPVVTIQGPRQSGKSVLVREMIATRLPEMVYLTLDNRQAREAATARPDSFLLENIQAAPLAIDEAQKAPDLFDAIKLQVDTDRRPGRYLLLGSTEFSREVLVKESLTGRLSRARLWPLNIAEAKELKPRPGETISPVKGRGVTRADLMRHLDHGGFPGIFAVRSGAERRALLADWINTTVYRDLLMFPRYRPDPALALDILRLIAELDSPDVGTLARTLRKDRRKIQTHVDLLTTLFVLHPLPSHPAGIGETRYFLCDAGLANYFEASLERRLHTQLIVERLSQVFYRTGEMPRLSYYRSAKSKAVHLVEQSGRHVVAVQIFTEDRVLPRETRRLEGCQRALLAHGPRLDSCAMIGLAPVIAPTSLGSIALIPWEAIA